MSKKIIVVNDIAACQGGGLTVLKDFYSAAQQGRKDIDWIFLLSEPYVEETPNIRVQLFPRVKKHFNRILFDSLFGGRIINTYHPDIIFSLQNTVVYHSKGKIITYVHQSIPFQRKKKYSFFKRDEFKLACIQYLLGKRIKKSIQNSDIVIVQTKWMKDAIERQCKVKTIKQIYPQLPKITEKATYCTTNSFFYPTSNASYKNTTILLEATKLLCKEGCECSTIVTVNSKEQIDNVKFIGKISAEEVYDNYRKSCLVFPSYIETFGYPLVEAKAVGTIILASDCEFSHELLDNYENAYFFDPFNVDSLKDLMRNVATGKIKRKTIDFENRCEMKNEIKNSWNKIIDILANSVEKN